MSGTGEKGGGEGSIHHGTPGRARETDTSRSLGPPGGEHRLPDPRVVHADDRLVVIDKPAWMLSVPGKGEEKQDCAVARVRAMYPKGAGPMVVHRLDMETSGLMVVGLDAESQRALSMEFEARRVAKEYIALLDGLVAGDDGTIDLPMRADITNRPVQVVDHEMGRPAETRWRVLSREIDRTRVRFEPLTGRTHQIRVHAALGMRHPIVGDGLYGGTPAERLMLHAAVLEFVHPETGRRVRFESGAPF